MPKPNKLLGQHFLVSRDVLDKIISTAGLRADETVLEIGPGRGILTRELARRAKRVVAVEKDRELAEQLEQKFRVENLKNVKIIQGDILKLTPRDLDLPKRFGVVANIPYYLTGRLIRLLLEGDRLPGRIVLMVQKEVAERMMAHPPSMNLLALSVQVYGTPKIEFVVPKTAFSPTPKVESAIISISNISMKFFKENKVVPALFFDIIRAGFKHRRKTLINSMLISLGHPQKELQELIQEAKIDPKRRAETLSPEEWITLVRAFAIYGLNTR